MRLEQEFAQFRLMSLLDDHSYDFFARNYFQEELLN